MHRRVLLVLLVALLAGAFTSIPAQRVRAANPPQPIAVVAHIDAGINPYHEAFRDRSPPAQRLDLARRVLAGTTPEPNRADVDAFFTTEGQVRRRVHHPERP